MSSNIVDAIASGAAPSEISQEIKDMLFAKSSERIDTFRTVTSDRMFSVEDEDAEVGEE